jgi:DMSO/TMAO reductase YedYZ molybdopterin-dependent catalytic subunit
VTRGFHRKRQEADPSQVPPGRYVTGDFPVLATGPTPRTALTKWSFSITGGQKPKSWTCEEFRALPAETLTTGIHCVTRWSKLDTKWRGVSLDVLLGTVEYDAKYVLAFCDSGYTTNMPVTRTNT